jgi:hypothetical protein
MSALSYLVKSWVPIRTVLVGSLGSTSIALVSSVGLDRVAVIGAQLFQERLKVVGVTQWLARTVGCRDRVGVGTTAVTLR